jgi:hypothetical protein
VRRIAVAILMGLSVIVTHLMAFAAAPQLQPIDDARAAAAGIRKISSRHLDLYTNVKSDAEVDNLPALFDQAVPQWATYFGIDPAKTQNWRARAFLIGDRAPFDALKLMPAANDQFVNGISSGGELWLHEQPTPYYRRHLLLHEGTHVFMATLLGGCGPGWYMEGTAELLGTHRIDNAGKLTLNIMPRDRKEVPMLGRIKLIHDALAGDHALSLPAVMQLDNSRQLGNDAYAWCWAAAKLLDSHPRYRDRFHKLSEHVLDPNFNKYFREEFAADWSDLNAEWQAYVDTLDHGYDFDRMAIDFQRGKPLEDGPNKVTIAADRGWQSSGVLLEAGKVYHIQASGRYQIAAETKDGKPTPWPCEPGGVTLEYHDGHPLGMLLGAIDSRTDESQRGARSEERGASRALDASTDESQPPPDVGFAHPIAIGLGTKLKSTASGTLYLRVNDAAGKLADNRGSLTVSIEAATAAPSRPR